MAPLAGGHKGLAVDLAHGAKEAAVRHIIGADVVLDHVFAGLREVKGHDGLGIPDGRRAYVALPHIALRLLGWQLVFRTELHRPFPAGPLIPKGNRRYLAPN